MADGRRHESLEHRSRRGGWTRWLAGTVLLGILGCHANRDLLSGVSMSRYALPDSTVMELQLFVEGAFELIGVRQVDRDERVVLGSVTSVREYAERRIEVVNGTPAIATSVAERSVTVDVGSGLLLVFTTAATNRQGVYHLTAINGQPLNNAITVNGVQYRFTAGRYTEGQFEAIGGAAGIRLRFDATRLLRIIRETERVRGRRLEH